MDSEETSQSTARPEAEVRIPSDALIIVPVRDAVIFPGTVAPITIARPRSVSAAQQALREQRAIGILLQRKPETEEPAPDDLHRVCTVANIVRYITAPDGTNHLICQGVQRARIVDFLLSPRREANPRNAFSVAPSCEQPRCTEPASSARTH